MLISGFQEKKFSIGDVTRASFEATAAFQCFGSVIPGITSVSTTSEQRRATTTKYKPLEDQF
jgi:hypothetical protein